MKPIIYMILVVVVILLGGAALVIREKATPRAECFIWGNSWSIVCNVEEK